MKIVTLIKDGNYERADFIFRRSQAFTKMFMELRATANGNLPAETTLREQHSLSAVMLRKTFQYAANI